LDISIQLMSVGRMVRNRTEHCGKTNTYFFPGTFERQNQT
jgi:hypothetical protein